MERDRTRGARKRKRKGKTGEKEEEEKTDRPTGCDQPKRLKILLDPSLRVPFNLEFENVSNTVIFTNSKPS